MRSELDCKCEAKAINPKKARGDYPGVIYYSGRNMKFIGDPERDAEIKEYIDGLKERE